MEDGGSSQSEDRTKKDGTKKDINFRFKAGAYLSSVAVLSGLAAFGVTLASVRKKDPKMFARGVESYPAAEESGVELALRALKWGTFYAVSGTSLIAFAIWKISGAKSLEEFREKARQILPKLPKKESEGRNDFSDLSDLLKYLPTENQKTNNPKKS